MEASIRLSNEQFRKRQRLRHRREFQAVFAHRNSAAGAHLVVYGRPNGLAFNRLGLSVSRRLGKAVVRNRFKRRCREAFRRTEADQPAGWDWIIAAAGTGKRHEAPSAERPASSLAAIRSEFLTLIDRIRRKERRRALPRKDRKQDT